VQALFAVQIEDHGGKLVSAEPGQRIAVAQGALHPEGQRRQKAIAGCMAIAVVDAFESIQVKIDDGQQIPVPVRMSHGLAKPVGEQRAIGRPVSAS